MHGLLEYLPRGNTLDGKAWQRRHHLLEWVVLLHVPGMLALGLYLGRPALAVGLTLIGPVLAVVLGHLIPHRRLASFFVTGGLVYCSAALVGLTEGTIEAHFHFFIIIGFIALYQDWVPFLWNVVFTVFSHGIGTVWFGGLIFSHPAGQANPWLWSLIHGLGVFAACVGVVIFWRITEDEQTEKEALGKQLITADAEIGRRRFASEMLVNLARRNQSMLYRQLDIINQLEEKEQDPDALAELFRLDHLATRVRRNAESLLVLAGEQPPRTWSAPVPLRDVIRAAIAETEDLDRVVYAVDDRAAVAGHTVADLTHLLAELTENAVRFSPPETAVTIRARPNPQDEGGQLLTVEDWGVGMPAGDMAEANELLSQPPEVDLAVSQRLGFHVVARLAVRHGIKVSLTATPGSGVTAVVVLPAALFTAGHAEPIAAMAATAPVPVPAVRPAGAVGRGTHAAAPGAPARVTTSEPGWAGAAAGNGGSAAPTATMPRPEPAAGATWMSSQASPPAGESELPGDAGNDWTGWWNPSADGHSGPGPVPGGPGPAPAAPLGSADGTPAARPGNGGPAGPAETAPVARSGEQPPSRHSIPRPRSEARPVPRPQPRPHDPPSPRPSVSAPGGFGLRRRVPQSHLAPELRQPEPESAPVAAQPPSTEAATALSRYQAHRQAARALVDPEADGEPAAPEENKQP
ncbi:ATP-binding protein [Pseudonocardia bannensis]|uniref:histidine kinase n=1 Tax=Pseudonocardia bannensis TaxID=630973 RepID=A0A848DQ29_9PSEU|nr:ATP-binding protein [Pseudonocardia bannensis]NMH94619.1 hypothetical protein [Pseudonocardia bannensis]